MGSLFAIGLTPRCETARVRNMISGEYEDPLRVVAFNTVEGLSRDVSEESPTIGLTTPTPR
jgi:hypothetical protein